MSKKAIVGCGFMAVGVALGIVLRDSIILPPKIGSTTTELIEGEWVTTTTAYGPQFTWMAALPAAFFIAGALLVGLAMSSRPTH